MATVRVLKRAEWYREPSKEDLKRMIETSLIQRKTGINHVPRSHGSSCRETILAIERQLNGGKQLSK